MQALRNYRLRILFLILVLEIALYVALSSAHRFTRVPTAHEPLANRLIAQMRKLKVIPKPEPKVIQDILVHSRFGTPSGLKRWEEKIFRNKTKYDVVTENGTTFLSSSSEGSSSGLYLKINHEVKPDFYLNWKWRAKVFPEKKDDKRLSNRREDDFAARIYVVFPGSNFFNSNVMEYIWDKSLPPGTLESSPFSDRVKLFVIRSGKSEENNGWVEEERNIYEDYVKLFGKAPSRSLGALAIMSDSDNTGTKSAADFGDIILKRKKIEEKS